MAPWSRSTSPTAPTRSPSLLLLGLGSNRKIHMDLPLMTTESEIPPVSDNLASVLDQTGSPLPHVNIIPTTPQSSQKEAGSHVVPPISTTTTHPHPPTLSPFVSLIAAVSTSIMEARWEQILPTPPWRSLFHRRKVVITPLHQSPC